MADSWARFVLLSEPLSVSVVQPSSIGSLDICRRRERKCTAGRVVIFAVDHVVFKRDELDRFKTHLVFSAPEPATVAGDDTLATF